MMSISLHLCLLFLYAMSVQGYLLNTSPCGKDLADISVFPGDSSYNASAYIWNAAYSGVKPAFVALPKTVHDVQRCLACAYENTVPFTMKSGGHSILGLSTINGSDDGAFVVSLSRMKAIEAVSESEIKVQAGATWEDIYEWVKKTEYIIVGGDCPTVGVAGFTLGGGMSDMSRKYGLGIDNALSFTMATIDGLKVVSADSNTNTDLYWALRGGGGGNFGVAVDFTLRLNPSFSSYTFGYMLIANDTSKNVPQVLSVIGAEDYEPELEFEFILGYGNELNVTFLNLGPVSSSSEAKLNKLRQYASEHESHEYATYWEARDAKVTAHSKLDVSSSYMMKACFLKTITSEVAKVITEIAVPKQCFHSFNHLGGAIAQHKPNDTAFPHRSSKFDIYTTCSYNGDAEMKICSNYLNNLYSSLEKMKLCEGNYINDPQLDLHDWQHKFYGENYERLVQIQEEWNPQHVGTYHYILSIGSDYNPPPAYTHAYEYNHVEL